MDEAAFFDNIKGTRHVNAPGELPPPDDRLDEEVARLRPPPQSREAEQSLLGCLLMDASALARVSDILATTDFFPRSHKLVYDAICTLAGEGAPVDVVSTFERLQRDGHTEDTGGLAYLNQLVQAVPSLSSVRRYAEIIVERATLRQIISQADEAATRAFKCEPAADILADTKARTSKLLEERKLGRGGIPLLTLAELRDQARNVSWLVKNVIPGDSIGMVFGASQTFKSFVALDAALHVAHGLPWLGRRTKQGPVIYVAAEGGTGLWKRIHAWHRSRKIPYTSTPMTVVPVAMDLTQDAWKIVEAAQAKGVTPALVVIDTLSQTYAGEENSANEVAAYFRELGARIRALWHCAVMIIHHSGHAATERPRGSTAMMANVDWMFGVHRDEKEMLATLSCTKQKDTEPFADASFSLTSLTVHVDEDGDEIRSLVARHLTNVDELQEAMERESKAGRGGHNHLLMSLLQNGIPESDLRQLFYRECGIDNADSRKKAWQRASGWAKQRGFYEVASGFVVTLKPDGQQS